MNSTDIVVNLSEDLSEDSPVKKKRRAAGPGVLIIPAKASDQLPAKENQASVKVISRHQRNTFADSCQLAQLYPR